MLWMTLSACLFQGKAAKSTSGRQHEDELNRAQTFGRFSAADIAAIGAAADRVIETIETHAWPFNAGWEQWRPDPAWAIPTIPPNWDAK